jgi:ribosomal protein S18 acetylase RimI-like enzyme
MPTLEIRRARPTDSARLTEIAHLAKAHWGYPAEWIVEWRSQLTLAPEYIERERVYVAEDHDTILGVCALEDHGSHWSLEHVWVDPSAQGHGLGRRLVEYALEVASDRPVRVESDPYAAAFYERLGAQRIGEVKAPVSGDPNRVLPLLEFAR